MCHESCGRRFSDSDPRVRIQTPSSAGSSLTPRTVATGVPGSRSGGVEFDRRAKDARLICSRAFAWHSLSAIAWRKRVGELGTALRVADMDGIRRKLGPKWAYRLGEAITLATGEDWQVFLNILGAEA